VRLVRENNSFYITDLKLEKKYEYQKYTRDNDLGSRHYNVGNIKIPSVTTILSATQSEEKKNGLDKWRQRVGYQEAQRITNQAATRGTEMHYVLENYIDGRGYINLSPEGALPRLMAHEIVDNLGKLKEVWGNEVSLAYEDRWAGATDVVGLYDEKQTIIDFKQSNKPKREEYVEDYYYHFNRNCCCSYIKIKLKDLVRLIRENNSFIITDLKRESKYDYQKYTRDNDLGSRHYNVGNKKIPSVTTILSATQSEEKKAGLDAWRERVGYQEAARITSQAALRGTEMHYVLENYIDGRGYLNLSPEGAQARLMAHEIVNNLDKLKIVYGNEVCLAYEDLWAGATDVVGLYDDKPTILDFKQSNKPKREEYVEDYYYQIAAYSLAHKKQYGPITQGLICICTKDVIYQEFKMDEIKLKEYEDKWMERVTKYHETKATSEPALQES